MLFASRRIARSSRMRRRRRNASGLMVGVSFIMAVELIGRAIK